MKRKSIFYSLLFLVCLVVSDKTQAQAKGIIVLNGYCVMFINLNEPFIDPWCTAVSDDQGDVSGRVIVTGSVDVTTPGMYFLNYDLPDSIAQTDSITRIVVVGESASGYANDSVNMDVDVYSSGASMLAYLAYLNTLGLDASVSGYVDYNTLGVYPLTLTIGNPLTNCPVTKTVMVNVVDRIAPIIVLLGTNPFHVCLGNVFLEPGVMVSDNYDSPNDVTLSVVADFQMDSAYVDYGPAHYIKYAAVDNSGNVSDTLTRTIYGMICDGVNEIGASSLFSIFPNPARDYIRVTNKSASTQNSSSLAIFDITGKEQTVRSKLINQEEQELNIENLKNGMYLLQVRTNLSTYSMKFQVAR